MSKSDNSEAIENLAQLSSGQSAVITEVEANELGLKFLEMGCLPGEKLSLERIAPMGDPIAVKVGDSLISMRKEEASLIKIKLIGN
jgi:ferrous iron transport protein A